MAILRIRFKTPDAVQDAIDSYVSDLLSEEDMGIPRGAWSADKEEFAEYLSEGLVRQCENWFPYGEYVTVEINTDNDTARVIRSK